jgi:hypothetical protein
MRGGGCICIGQACGGLDSKKAVNGSGEHWSVSVSFILSATSVRRSSLTLLGVDEVWPVSGHPNGHPWLSSEHSVEHPAFSTAWLGSSGFFIGWALGNRPFWDGTWIVNTERECTIPPVFLLTTVLFVPRMEGNVDNSSQNLSFEGQEGASGVQGERHLDALTWCLPTTVLSPDRRVVRGTLLEGCAVRVSPGEGETTSDRIMVLVDTLKRVSGFVIRRVLSLVIDFVLMTFVALVCRLETIGGNTCLGSSFDGQADVAHIEVTGGRLGSIWAAFGAGERLCMLCLILTTILSLDCCISVVALLGGCEGWLLPREGESTPGWSTSARCGPVDGETLDATTRYASTPVSVPGLMTPSASCRWCITEEESMSSSFEGREGVAHNDVESDWILSFCGLERAACIERASD